MIRNYIKITFRRIRNRKLNSFISLSGLSLGLCSFILIFLWIRDETSFDTFHNNKENLFRLSIIHPEGIVDPNVPYALGERLQSEFPEIKYLTRIFRISTLSNNSIKYQKEETDEAVFFYEDEVVLVDSSFFKMFTFQFESGEVEHALSSPNAIVISSNMKDKYFGDQDPMNKVLTVNNEQSFIVRGVVNIPKNTQFKYDFYIPISFDLSSNWNWRDPSYLWLDENVDLGSFRKKIKGTLNRFHPGPLDGEFQVDIIPVTRSYLSFGRMKYVHIFSAIAILILIIACINYINFSTASTNNRSKEIGVQKVSGASRYQLAFQIITDSIMQCLIALCISLILVEVVLPFYNDLVDKELKIGYLDNPQILLILVLIAAVTGAISGIFPALILTRTNPITAFYTSQRIRSDRSVFRIISVVGQFTISMILIAGTVLIFKQMTYMKNRPLGITTDHIVKIPLNRSMGNNYESIRAELLNNPRINSLTLSQEAPINEDYKTGVDWENKDPNFVSLFRYSIASPGFVETFGIEVLEGRDYLHESRADMNNFLVNETAVRYMNLEEPIGKGITFWGQQGTIIGVIKDYHHVSLHREILPQIVVSNPTFYRALKYLFVKIDGNEIPATIDYVKKIILKFSPDYPFEYQFIDDEINSMYLADQKLGKIISYFAALAILISCMGIFGLALFNIEQKTKEISIRKINGASAKNILLLVNKDFLKWIFVAFVIASPSAYVMLNIWLRSYAYKTPISWWIFALSGFIALIISLVTISRLSIKAAHVNPVDNLRYE